MFADGKRGEVQRAFARICQDSGFRMDLFDAASLTSDLLDLPSGLTVMEAFGFSTMEKVANGELAEQLKNENI